MSYIKDGVVVTLTDIRRAHPQLSVPATGVPNLAHLGYALIDPVEAPAPGANEIVARGDPEEYAPGHWRETWVVQPAPPPPVPQTVSRFQARAALHLAGLLSAVETLMSDPATDAIARIAWADAQEFRRTSPTVLAMAAALDLTDEQLDTLFITAAGVEA